jgi:hypothetical protein
MVNNVGASWPLPVGAGSVVRRVVTHCQRASDCTMPAPTRA